MVSEILSDDEWGRVLDLLPPDWRAGVIASLRALRADRDRLAAALAVEVEARNEAWEFGDRWREKANALAARLAEVDRYELGYAEGSDDTRQEYEARVAELEAALRDAIAERELVSYRDLAPPVSDSVAPCQEP